MKILIIEDHPYKLNQLLEYLQETFSDFEVVSRGSYNSGVKEIILNHNEYAFILLDISMPNYDISSGESGGDFIPLAGKLILKEMYLRDLPTPVIVVTMYESFVDGSLLSMLDKSFKQDFSDNYKGFVYFTASSTLWKDQLTTLINRTIDDTNTTS